METQPKSATPPPAKSVTATPVTAPVAPPPAKSVTATPVTAPPPATPVTAPPPATPVTTTPVTTTPVTTTPVTTTPVTAPPPAKSVAKPSFAARMQLDSKRRAELAGQAREAMSSINLRKMWRSNILGIVIFLWIVVSSVADVANRKVQGGGNTMVALHLLFAYCSVPFLLEVYPFLINWKWQALVAILVLILDWVSLREDKTRFSERPGYFLMSAVDSKITGRQNAALTGIAAHLADVLGLVMILIPLAKFSWKMFALILIPAIIYSVVGGYYIINMTKDGSQSDVRKLTEKVQEIETLTTEGGDEEDIAKLKVDAYDAILSSKRNVQMPNIWPDYERQMINLVITYLGALASWQAIFSTYGTWDGEGRLTKIERAYFGITRKDVPEDCKVAKDVDLSKKIGCQPWWEGKYSSVTNFVFINCFTHMFYAFIGPLIPFTENTPEEGNPIWDAEKLADPACVIGTSGKSETRFKWSTVIGLTFVLSTLLNSSGLKIPGFGPATTLLLVFTIVLLMYIVVRWWDKGFRCWLNRFWVSMYMISRFMLPFFGVVANVIMTALPNYNNWINTGYQAAAPAGELFLHDVPILSDGVGKEILNEDNTKKLKEYKKKIKKAVKTKFGLS